MVTFPRPRVCLAAEGAAASPSWMHSPQSLGRDLRCGLSQQVLGARAGSPPRQAAVSAAGGGAPHCQRREAKLGTVTPGEPSAEQATVAAGLAGLWGGLGICAPHTQPLQSPGGPQRGGQARKAGAGRPEP